MPYPGQFHRLVVMGTLYTDVFNFSMSIVPHDGDGTMPAVSDAQLLAVANVVGTWWPKTTAALGSGAITAARLTGIKLNRIGADGRYVDEVTKEHTYPSAIAGTGVGVMPAQVALAVTLRTAIDRGRASKGRFYLPPTDQVVSNIGSDGRISVGGALGTATAARALINSINATYDLVGRVGVASNAGVGRFEIVTKVSVGRVPDTIRSRRSTQAEEPSEITLL